MTEKTVKHTPRPWLIGVSVDNSGSRPWPVFRLGLMNDPNPDGAEVQADRALIEAAPDMLAALEVAANSFRCLLRVAELEGADTPGDYEVLESMQAAIAKARGDA